MCLLALEVPTQRICGRDQKTYTIHRTEIIVKVSSELITLSVYITSVSAECHMSHVTVVLPKLPWKDKCGCLY